MDDVVTPNFRAKINDGLIVNNPCTYVKESINNLGSGHQKWYRNSTKTWWYESLGHVTAMNMLRIPSYVTGEQPAPGMLFDHQADSRLTALANIDRAPYSFAEDIAEMRETWRFLANPLGSMKHLSNNLVKDAKGLLSRKRSLNLAQAIAQVWLEYQFALSPLLRSANDAYASMFDKVHAPERRTARGFSDESAKTNVYHAVIAGHVSESQTFKSVESKSGILYHVTNPVNDWRYKYGLRFKDIPETLWAIMPLSFMVDRMINFSQVARALTAFLDPKIEILTAWTTTKSEEQRHISYKVYNGAIVISIEAQEPDTRVRTIFTYDRQPWDIGMSDFIPGFYPKALVNSVTKVADLSALILQLVRT
jgi:hypothetical protein